MPTISLAMCVLDEEETLAHAIESVLPVVDEIVIGVDSKCTDKTPEIAEKYASAGKCFTYEWNNNFSEARNQVIEKCTSDYVLILDGHEHFPADDDPILMKMLKMRKIDANEQNILTPLSYLALLQNQGLPEEFDVLCFTLCMNTDQWGTPTLFFLQPRLFRNDSKIKYTSSVHNYLTGYRDNGAMGSPEVIIVHNMPEKREAARKKQRAKMNIKGLKEDIKKDPKNGRAYFYVANSYADMGKPKTALAWYRKYLKYSQFGEERYQTLQQLGILEFRVNNDEQAARKYLMDAMIQSYTRTEPFVLLGEMAEKAERWDEAIHWYSLAADIKAPDSVMFIQGAAYAHMPYTKMMSVYAKSKQWEKAIEAAHKALQWVPGHPKILEDLESLKRLHAAENKGADRNMLVVDALGSFSGPLAESCTGLFNVARRDNANAQWIGWSDVIFCEWCDQNAIHLSRQHLQCPLVIRLHSYEAFSDMPSQVNWANVRYLVFVAEHIRDLFLQRWPDVPKTTEIFVIPNGVDINGWKFKKRDHGRKIGVLSYLNHKKGIETLCEVVKTYPEHEFHIGGKWQDPHLQYFFQGDLQGQHNVYFHEWIEPSQKPAFLDGLDYLISTSIVESFQFAIAEAMLSGVKPLIRQRPGALYGPCTWHKISDIEGLIAPDSPYESEVYRDFIIENFRAEKSFGAIRQLLDHAANQYVLQATDELVERAKQDGPGDPANG